MPRRVRRCFDAGPPRLLPRISACDRTGARWRLAASRPPCRRLRRRLELIRLVATLLDQQPDLAPRAALFDLADSLAALMDEMQGEGVPPEVSTELDVCDLSGHWDRTAAFLGIVDGSSARRARRARRRGAPAAGGGAAIARLAGRPPHASGDRRRLDRIARDDRAVHGGGGAAAAGRRGAAGLRFRHAGRMSGTRLDDAMPAEDHPQYRFRSAARGAGTAPRDVARWTQARPPSPARNAAGVAGAAARAGHRSLAGRGAGADRSLPRPRTA